MHIKRSDLIKTKGDGLKLPVFQLEQLQTEKQELVKAKTAQAIINKYIDNPKGDSCEQ